MSSWKATGTPYVQQDNEGNHRIRVYARDPITGKRIWRTKPLPEGLTPEQMELARDAFQAQVQEEIEGPPEPEKGMEPHPSRIRPEDTVASYFRAWWHQKRKRVRSNVATNYLRDIENWVLPHFGHIPCGELSRAHVEDKVRWMEARRKSDGSPYSHATVGRWWRLLRQGVQDMVADLELPRDPSARVRPPQGSKKKVREQGTLSPEELGRLLKAMRQFFPQHWATVVVLVFTGLRASEAMGMQWTDLDRAQGTLRLSRAVVRGKVAPLKTEEPREIWLHPKVWEALDWHREELIRAQHPGLAEGWCFPADHGGPRYHQVLKKPLKEAAKYAKISVRVSPQVLRRTFNTLMARADVDRIVLRSMIGHTTEEMTERYAGVPVERKRDAIERVFGDV